MAWYDKSTEELWRSDQPDGPVTLWVHSDLKEILSDLCCAHNEREQESLCELTVWPFVNKSFPDPEDFAGLQLCGGLGLKAILAAVGAPGPCDHPYHKAWWANSDFSDYLSSDDAEEGTDWEDFWTNPRFLNGVKYNAYTYAYRRRRLLNYRRLFLTYREKPWAIPMTITYLFDSKQKPYWEYLWGADLEEVWDNIRAAGVEQATEEAQVEFGLACDLDPGPGHNWWVQGHVTNTLRVTFTFPPCQGSHEGGNVTASSVPGLSGFIRLGPAGPDVYFDGDVPIFGTIENNISSSGSWITSYDLYPDAPLEMELAIPENLSAILPYGNDGTWIRSGAIGGSAQFLLGRLDGETTPGAEMLFGKQDLETLYEFI